jgi:hypothetical protein
MKTINIKTIRIDGGTQSRVEINNEIVTEYAEAIKAGAEFPAVVVFNDGADNWLADGFHRFHGHNQAGLTSILADVRQGTVRDAKLFSFGANGKHGQRPTQADRRKAVDAMLADPEWVLWSNSAIAKTCDVSDKTVAARRNSIFGNSEDAKPTTRTVERNGKTYEQNTAKIGVKQHRDAAKSAHEADVARGGNGVVEKQKQAPVVATPAPEAPAEDDGAPDAAELEASRIHQEAQAKTIAFMLASDEPLADLAARNTQLEAQIKQLDLRIAGLQNSNNEYIKRIKSLQNQLKKVQS